MLEARSSSSCDRLRPPVSGPSDCPNRPPESPASRDARGTLVGTVAPLRTRLEIEEPIGSGRRHTPRSPTSCRPSISAIRAQSPCGISRGSCAAGPAPASRTGTRPSTSWSSVATTPCASRPRLGPDQGALRARRAERRGDGPLGGDRDEQFLRAAVRGHVARRGVAPRAHESDQAVRTGELGFGRYSLTAISSPTARSSR